MSVVAENLDHTPERHTRGRLAELYPVRVVDGRRYCAWCGNRELTGGRRRYCSQACQDEVWVRTSASFARSSVEKRDRGVCALCGLNTEAMALAFLNSSRKIRPSHKKWQDDVAAFDRTMDFARRVHFALVRSPSLTAST